jgi:hypothetical protein
MNPVHSASLAACRATGGYLDAKGELDHYRCIEGP